MIVTVTIQTENGPRVYTGHIVTRGPSTMEMLLTEPYPVAGRCVQFPTTAILTEERRSPMAVGRT